MMKDDNEDDLKNKEDLHIGGRHMVLDIFRFAVIFFLSFDSKIIFRMNRLTKFFHRPAMTAIHLFNGSWTNRSRVGKEFVRNLQIISNISLKKVRWTIHFRSIKNFSFFPVWINTV